MSEALLLLEAEAEVLEMTEPSSEERLEVTMLDTADTLALELQTKVHTKVRNQSRRRAFSWLKGPTGLSVSVSIPI